MPPEIQACLPVRLHPVSRMFLDALLEGRMTIYDFRWAFHLPNSDYIQVGECILKALADMPNRIPTLRL